MLSRVADSLFWMSRYVERADNIARILDVNLQHMLDLPKRDEKALTKVWAAILRSTGDDKAFYQEYQEATADNVIDFLTANHQNHNSIVNCVVNARENARHVREQISDDMWEEVNRMYLGIKGLNLKKVYRQGLYEFFKSVLEGSQLFQGTTDATMSHGMGWDFIQAGKFIERADKTTRILDANSDVLADHAATWRSTSDTLRLSAILRSCSAHAAYRRVYVADIRPAKVVEFLVLNDKFPRSIRFCVGQLDQALRRVNGTEGERFTNLAEKLSGRIDAELNYSSVEDIVAPGLHKTMDSIQRKLNELGAAICATYMGYESSPSPPPAGGSRQPGPSAGAMGQVTASADR
jgi:uncharacterized alpha-E superfamily protein